MPILFDLQLNVNIMITLSSMFGYPWNIDQETNLESLRVSWKTHKRSVVFQEDLKASIVCSTISQQPFKSGALRMITEDTGFQKHLFRKWRGRRKTSHVLGTGVSLMGWFMEWAEMWVGMRLGWGAWGHLGCGSFWDKNGKCGCCTGSIFSASLKSVSWLHHS